MKNFTAFFLLVFPVFASQAQPSRDTTLKEQKENVIRETTIVQVENLGDLINTDNPEMRPTISADGNLLFFIRQNDPGLVDKAPGNRHPLLLPDR